MKVQVLCGMIASGKSTYCQNVAKTGAICVNDDAIINMVHSDNYALYDKNLKILYKSIENQAIVTALALGRTVVIDRGLNCNPSGRKRWIALAKSLDVCCEAVAFKNEGPLVHANRRNNSDSRGRDLDYWLRVANIHNAEYVEPSTEEGFDSVRHITWEEIKSFS